MMKNMRRGIPSMFKSGVTHLTGVEEAILRNCQACKELTTLTRTSLGPHGMRKMIINHIGKTFVTTDTATIIKEMEITHPAAKIVVMAAQMQENEIGDGNNFVVCLAGELMGLAEGLIRMGLHPSEIITGYNMAKTKALEIIDNMVVETLSKEDMHDAAKLSRAIYASMGSKQYTHAKLLSGLVAEACAAVMPENTFNFLVDTIRVAKIPGGNVSQSRVVQGMVISSGVEGSIKQLTNARIAVFTCSIALAETETQEQIVVRNAKQLLDYSEQEEKRMEDMIRTLSESGVNMVVSGSTVDDMAAHYLEKFGIMVLRISSKFELRRLCRTVKARPLVTFGPVNKQYQGFVKSVRQEEIGGRKVTIFTRELNESAITTIILRASTSNVLNDLERAIDHGVNTVRALARDGRVLAGGGAVEIELARQLAAYGATETGLSQHSIKKFAEAFETFPRALADTCGFNAVSTLSDLYRAHEVKGGANMGVNVETGELEDTKKTGVLDSLAVKKFGIEFATDAACTILRVDKIIQSKMAGGPKNVRKGHWDDDD